MIYRLKEADSILSRLDNDFNVNSGDWIPRVPQWLYQCLSDLNIYLSLIPKAHVSIVSNYSTNIPDDLQLMTAIEYNGSRLTRIGSYSYKPQSTSSNSSAYIKTNVGITLTGTLENVTLDDSLSDIEVQLSKIRVYDASSVIDLPGNSETYRLIPNGTIETSFEEGLIVFHYYSFPSAYNERLNSLCPLIPDNNAVEDAATWYIFQSILQRGHKHPVFTLGNPNWKLDPFERYRKARLNAKNKSNKLDKDQARIVDAMWQSHLYNVISKPI